MHPFHDISDTLMTSTSLIKDWVSEVMALHSVCMTLTLKYTEGKDRMTVNDQLAHLAELVQTIFKADRMTGSLFFKFHRKRRRSQF